ncbi:alkaline shock response membrane anchor protein AmaP [Streptomyces sp. AC563]|uniref:alkaline shock response membrane anchor protein AmaP n=1 Tax=Streptomyces buecherae TaxID=2763006 RepID=UPI00164E7677|nr:alkaline shock response membrane anchor protein AmaP [Streptomyces buecherae]MBC3990977.1 alkaline shock response membrane anchor protein AmaP [Streptomyces buecherae]
MAAKPVRVGRSRVRVVNRVLLGLAGLLLLALGAAVLVGGLDLPRRWNFGLPGSWPFDGPDDVLLTHDDRRRWRDEGWWWPTVIAALALIVLLTLWWLLAQARRRRLREVWVASGEGEGAVLRGRALEGVLAAEAEAMDGVDRARVTLRGRRTAPEARVRLVLAAHAQPAETLARLRAEALEHARASAGLDRLPAEVRMRAVRHRAERVS